MRQITDDEVKIGDYGVYIEHKTYKDNPKDQINKEPRGYKFIIYKDAGAGSGRYKYHRHTIEFLGDAPYIYDSNSFPEHHRTMMIRSIIHTAKVWKLDHITHVKG